IIQTRFLCPAPANALTSSSQESRSRETDRRSSYDYRTLGARNLSRKFARDRRERLSRQTSVPRRHERRQPFTGGIAWLGGQSVLLSAKHSSQRLRDPFQLSIARSAPDLDSSHSRSRWRRRK